MILYRVVTVVAVSVCFGVSMAADAPVQARWRRIDTSNFVVIGDVSGSTLRDVATKFEGFRDALGRILNERLIATIVPTVIVVFSTDDAYKPFKPKYKGRPAEVSGAFMPGRDINYITIGDPDELRLLFHEYTHLLVQNTGLTVPVWLGEGFAEYYSTLEFLRSGREVQVGGLIGGHLARLNDTVLIPLEQFLQLTHDSPLYNEGSRQSVLYAQAWAMTHMLHLGEPNRRAELTAYLQHVTSGMPSLDAWKQAFGGFDAVRELQQYIRRRLFTAHKHPLDEKVASVENLPVTDISRSDADAYLSQILMRLREPQPAADRLAAARQREPDNASVRVTEAMAAVAKNDYAQAAQRLQGLDLGRDWLLSYQAGASLADVMERQPLALTDANLEAVRARFTASAGSRPMMPHAAYRLALLEARRGAVSAETKASLDQARRQTPGRYEYHLMYAQILGRDRDFTAARDILGPLMNPRSPPQVRELARRLMGTIADAEIGKPVGDIPLEAVSSGASTSERVEREPVTRPVFRETKPGETRLEGLLQAIECVAGKGITFHVTTAGSAELFRVPSFDGIEFITYRTELAGNIGCGPLKPLAPVYLTWRPGATAESRVVVAIEFLPLKQAAAALRVH